MGDDEKHAEPSYVHVSDLVSGKVALEAAQAAAREAWMPEVRALTAAQVLDLHADLHRLMVAPPPRLTEWLTDYMNVTVDKARKEGGLDAARFIWSHMFWPARDGAEYAKIAARQLAQARTYQVTAEMSGVVTALYRKTVSQIHHVQPEDVPCPSGFVYLDEPVILRDRFMKRVATRYLVWTTENILYEEGSKPGVRITTWTRWDDRDDFWADQEAREFAIRELGGINLEHTCIIPFGMRFPPQEEGGPESVVGWLQSLWLVMESEISVTRRPPVDRHARRRAARSLKHGEVNVILLRRAAVRNLEEGEPGHRYVDWSCRWFVQGFWRHQHKQDHAAVPDQARDHCVACGGAISWVRPHLKGPSDKPLKTDRQLYRLAR